SVTCDCVSGLIREGDEAPKFLPERSISIWRSLRLGGWFRQTLGESASCGRRLIRPGQLALRVFQVIADDQRHIFIEIFDPIVNAINSEISAENASRHGAQRSAFPPLPERVALADVRLWAIIDARA